MGYAERGSMRCLRHFRTLPTVVAALALLGAAPAAQDVVGEFPAVQVPPENPLTPAKVRLGQALFFEEQLSSDDTMACATCHRFEAGGGDPRPAGRAHGADGVLHTPDDEFGAEAMFLRDVDGKRDVGGPFGAGRQVTARQPPTVIGAAFFNTQFWDTRALPTFRDEAGGVVIPELAALESQAVGPLISSVEMSHRGRTWAQLTAKLAASEPLALARDLPAPLAEFLGDADYGALFERAFGSPGITRERIAMAITSYERTLVAERTPFDLGTMTPAEERGYELFREHGACEICHVSRTGLFTDGARRTISLPDHARAVKTPTLRNVGLRRRFMSSGQFTTLSEVVAHYESLDFIHFETASDRQALLDFVGHALTDPRVARCEPPFDRPRLASEVRVDAPAPAEGATTPAEAPSAPRAERD
jgi:cytochrome c peroxidase